MGKNHIFDTNKHDLGGSSKETHNGLDRLGVDEMFNTAGYNPDPICIVCEQPARYRFIPKTTDTISALIEDKGFLCSHCLKQCAKEKSISPDTHVLQDLQEYK